MSEAIEPGDLVRVIRSHCPAAWAEEQGTYFVVTAVAHEAQGNIYCEHCMQDMHEAVYVEGFRADPEYAHPAAWLRKVPGLTADEVCEELNHLLEVV